MRVLLVDDNRLMLEGLQNLLEAHGIEVAGMAEDGSQAVALARQLNPDVILMDIRMPGCDGLQRTRRPESSS
jgi:YesN/AraC family two-component response regulator